MNISNRKVCFLHPAKRIRLFWIVLMLAWPLSSPHQLQAKSIPWQRHAFPLPDSIWSVAAVDTNADGSLDIIAMGQSQVFVLASPDWKPRVLIDTREPKMLYCVAFDADRDGDLDVAVGRFKAPWIAYRQALAEEKEAQKPEGPDFSLAWIENSGSLDAPWRLHVMDRQLCGIHGLWTGDINRDGIDDLIAGSVEGPFFPRSIAWFQTPDSRGGNVSFERRIITRDGAGGRPHYLGFSDLNGDGQGDVLLGDSGDGIFSWWQQGADQDQPWTRHIIAAEKGATNIRAARIDGNESMDIVGGCGHGRGVFWFENPKWEKHAIDTDLNDAHAVDCGDFDGDGDMDVAAASYTEFVVRWYENDGAGTFAAHDIDTDNEQQAYDLKVTDLDADGRLDFLLAGRQSKNVVWYQNQE